MAMTKPPAIAGGGTGLESIFGKELWALISKVAMTSGVDTSRLDKLSKSMEGLSPKVSEDVMKRLLDPAAGGQLQKTLLELMKTGAPVDVSGAGEAAKTEAERMFRDISAGIQESMAAGGKMFSSAQTGFEDVAGKDVSTIMGEKILRAEIEAQEAAAGRRMGAAGTAMRGREADITAAGILGGLEMQEGKLGLESLQSAAGTAAQAEELGLSGEQLELQSRLGQLSVMPGLVGMRPGGGVGSRSSPVGGGYRASGLHGDPMQKMVSDMIRATSRFGVAERGLGGSAPAQTTMPSTFQTGLSSPLFRGLFSGDLGGKVPGADSGDDEVLALLRPEEVVIPPELVKKFEGAKSKEPLIGAVQKLAKKKLPCNKFQSGGRIQAGALPDYIRELASEGGWAGTRAPDPLTPGDTGGAVGVREEDDVINFLLQGSPRTSLPGSKGTFSEIGLPPLTEEKKLVEDAQHSQRVMSALLGIASGGQKREREWAKGMLGPAQDAMSKAREAVETHRATAQAKEQAELQTKQLETERALREREVTAREESVAAQKEYTEALANEAKSRERQRDQVTALRKLAETRTFPDGKKLSDEEFQAVYAMAYGKGAEMSPALLNTILDMLESPEQILKEEGAKLYMKATGHDISRMVDPATLSGQVKKLLGYVFGAAPGSSAGPGAAPEGEGISQDQLDALQKQMDEKADRINENILRGVR